ncbi:MAG: alpha/beta hydrolase [Treponema sp.]
MAVIDVNFFSKSLFRSVSFKAIIPVDRLSLTEDTGWDKKPFKTLYLLHGAFDDCNAWINNTRIVRWASERNLAVIMPSGENMFYVDAPAINGGERPAPVGEQYSKFIGEELVETTRNLFPLSKKREDTFIGGLSMGGFGALYNGCKYYKTFSHIAALSPAMIIEDAKNSSYNKAVVLNNKAFYERFFGDLSNLDENEKNPYRLIKKLKTEKIELPKIYLACGKNDHLFKYVEDFAAFLMTQGTDFVFEKSAGGHDWNFWDTYIQHVLDWLKV